MALTACAGASHPGGGSSLIHVDGGSTAAATGLRGDRLPHPDVLTAASTAAVFRSTAGHDTTLGALGQGRLMLLYFGYTHCPDVCPTTMADIAVAMRQVPGQVAARTQVVFITSDPARDTTPVMAAWLNHFDPGVQVPFVGLTASVAQIDRVATSVGVPLFPPVRHPDGTVTVQHGAQTLAFSGGKASVVWLAGTSSDDYAHDITALAQNPATP